MLKRVAFFTVCIFLAACSRGPVLEYLPPDAVILAFGDSLTRGTGAAAGESYPEQLAALIGREVINRGVPGETSAQGLTRLPGVLDEVQPQLLLLCHGGNDILRTLSMTQMQSNLQQMIDLARERDIQVVLIGVPKRSLLLREEPIYHELAEQNSLPLLDDIVADVLGESELRSDRVHPNRAGYRQMAEAVQELLLEKGAL
ncbi:arylesterase [Gilvimarinus xylanilyticus]|uniref:Arylesterase n=1 Tax=Gilvimarinus xylanilyticus TaxID=2944139 RepID=A0A9X2I2R2_9GAMM|nr:arylesterase [Gilvimarinus xylanilyticus]MCP8897857.1 arylesterase [Gilvimarinus xylanilyticus]